MLYTVLLMFIVMVVLISLSAIIVYKKNLHIWLGSYITRRVEPPIPDEPLHIIFAFVDHYEPGWGNPPYEKEVQRVDEWCKRYPVMVENHVDADGCYPKPHIFLPRGRV